MSTLGGGNIGLLNRIFALKSTGKSRDKSKDGDRIQQPFFYLEEQLREEMSTNLQPFR